MAKRNKGQDTRVFYISLLNVISALSVVMLHANGAFWSYREGHNWTVNNIIESVFYFAVPIFFMLSGATLIDYKKRYSTKTFLKRRFAKILIPFAFWSIFGVFYYAVVQQHGWKLSISDIFNALFSGSYVGIFWFFPPLICIYLALPLFASIMGNKKPLLKYLVIVGFVMNIAMPFIINLSNHYLSTSLKWPYEVSVMSGYLIYPVVGYLLHNHKISKKQRTIIYILAIISLVVHIIGTHILSRENGTVVCIYKGYLNMPCFFYSIGVFVFVKQLCNSEKIISIFKTPTLFLHKYTFALYLTHYFALDSVRRIISVGGIYSNQLKYIPIVFLLAIPICILVTFLIRKIPKIGIILLP